MYYFLQILAELLELRKITEKLLFTEIEKMIEKLTKYYSVKNMTKTNVDNKALIMQHLLVCTDLKSKKNKKVPALFTLKDVSIGLNTVYYSFLGYFSKIITFV